MLEGGIALLSDVWERPRLVVLGQATLAVSLAFSAWTTSAWGLTFGLAIAGASSGVACGAAQGMLLAARPGDADRILVRWSFACAIGDVLTPLVTAAAIALGHSYRSAMGGIAVLVAAQCVISAALWRRSPPSPRDLLAEAEPVAEPLRAALARAAHRPRLWAWLFAAASCTLLDELVIALSALRLERDQGASAALAAVAAVAFSIGSVVGAALTDRAVSRTSTRAVLATSALVCALSLVGLLASAGPLVTCAALFAVGVTSAPHHPLAQARAYAELPDRPGTVQAIGQIFVVVEVVAPLALGALADRFGLDAAIGCLLLQPAIVLALVSMRGRR